MRLHRPSASGSKTGLGRAWNERHRSSGIRARRVRAATALASRLRGPHPDPRGHGSGQKHTFPWGLRLEIDVNHDRDVVAETRATPVLEGADQQLAHVDEPGCGQKDVIDMIGGAVLSTVPPVDRR